MKSSLQAAINPFTGSEKTIDYGNSSKAKPSSSDSDLNRADFRDLLTNSNEELRKEREAKANNPFTGKETEAEFLEKLAEKTRPKREPKNVLDKDDFLKLLVAQLQHQDPLNPDDSAEMASKLAQFNGLEQMMNVNKTLEKILATQSSSRNSELVNYIGKEVTIEGGRISYIGEKVSEALFEVDQPVTSTTLEIRDSSGTVVSQSELGGFDAGTHKVPWNGLGKDGTPVPFGIYTYHITAKNINGEDVKPKIKTDVKITGVDINDNEGLLYTSHGKIKLKDITAIGEEGFRSDLVQHQKKSEATKPTDKTLTKNTIPPPQMNGNPSIESNNLAKADTTPNIPASTILSEATKPQITP